MSEATVGVHATRAAGSRDSSAENAHEARSVMKPHGEDGPSSRVRDAAAGPSPAGEESSAAGGAAASDQGGSFDCNICLELAQDPVVTLCGHLFCWPCLYRWLQMHSICQECPVCKASVEEEKVIPLYGRGKVNCVDPRTKAVPGLNIPHRPAGQRPETARHAEHPYPPPGFNFMAGSAGPAATARFGLGLNGVRQFPELRSGFFAEPSIFFNDDEWISTDVTFVNLIVNEAPSVDANEGPDDASMNGGSPVDVNEGPFVDANENPPMNANDSLPVDANGDDEGQSYFNESPFEDANEGPPQNADDGPAIDVNEGPPVVVSEDANDAFTTGTNQGLNVNVNEGVFVDANEDPLVDVTESLVMTANEGPSVVDVSEGLHVGAPSGNSALRSPICDL